MHFGRCDCDCDQCTEGNNWVTDVLEAFSMVEQREMTPQDWVQMSQEEKAAYKEFKEDADSEAAQTEGLPEADDERAVEFLARGEAARGADAWCWRLCFRGDVCDAAKELRSGTQGACGRQWWMSCCEKEWFHWSMLR